MNDSTSWPAPKRSSARPKARASLMSAVGRPVAASTGAPVGVADQSPGTLVRKTTTPVSGTYSPGTATPQVSTGPSVTPSRTSVARAASWGTTLASPRGVIGRHLPPVERVPAVGTRPFDHGPLDVGAAEVEPDVARTSLHPNGLALLRDARVGRGHAQDDQAEHDAPGAFRHLQHQQQGGDDLQDQGAHDGARVAAAPAEDGRPADDRRGHRGQHQGHRQRRAWLP